MQWAGVTKWVGGTHPDAYATLTAALAASSAGDHIMIMSNYTITADETINVADIRISFAPGVKITISTGCTFGLIFAAARIYVCSLRAEATLSGTLTSFFKFTSAGVDCSIERCYLNANNAGLTVTSAVLFDASSARNLVTASKIATLGTITNAFTDNGTDNDPTIRG
jgi:hypothetical protein